MADLAPPNTTDRKPPKAPAGLGTRGGRLWRDLAAVVDFDPAELVILEEACRMADRLDKLDKATKGEPLRLRIDDILDEVEADRTRVEVTLVVDGAMSEARQQANVLKQLLAALRLPDGITGARPHRQPGARGRGEPKLAGGKAPAKVASLDRFRAAASK